MSQNEKPSTVTSFPSEVLRSVAIASIVIDGNIRTNFDDESIKELCQSIQVSGLLSPIRIEPEKDKFRLIHGERRLRAARLAGWTHIPAIVVSREGNDRVRLREMLVENCQRENLKPLETAQALASLKTELGGTAAQVAQEVGFSESKVSRLLAMLQWPEDLQDRVNNGRLKLGAAAELARLSDAERSVTVARVEKGELTRDSLAGSRKQRNRNRPASTKLARIRAVLGNERTVTVVAPALDLEAMIQLLQELLEKARKVRAQGLELGTFVKVLQDTARSA